MRRSRSLVLGVLLAVLALVGGVPAASPALAGDVDDIEWDMPVPLIGPWSLLRVCPTGDGVFPAGHEVVLDVMLGGIWVQRAVLTDDQRAGCLEAWPPDVLPGPGRYFLRARTLNAQGQPVSANIALTAEREQGISGINGNGLPTLYLYTTTPDKAVTATAQALGQSVDLQRRSGSSWIHVGRVTLPDTGDSVPIRFRLPSKAGNVTYRLVNRAATWTPLNITYPFLVHQTDYEKHENYLIRARRLMAAYCPKTPIHIDTSDLANGMVQYTHVWNVYDDAARRVGLTSRIALRSGLAPVALQRFAVEACAEVVQVRPHVESRLDEERAKALYLYRRNADLAQAGCMTYAATGVTWDGVKASRTTSCTTMQLDNARRMWSYYGTRYQDVPYWYDEF